MDRSLAAWAMDGPDTEPEPARRLPLTPRIRLALPSGTRDDVALRTELVALAHRQLTAARGDAGALVDDLWALATCVLQDGAASDHRFASRLLTVCGMHRVAVGRAAALLDAQVAIVAHAGRSTDARARFRVYRLAFGCALGRGDLKHACEHAEAAYRAALAARCVAVRFESLVLVVQLLEAMGLWRDALRLALDLVVWRDDDAPLGTLPAVNAIHGLRAARRLEDVAAAGHCHAKLCALQAAGALVDGMAVAMVAAANAAHHTWIGKPRAAARAVELALAQAAVHDDARASAVLRIAEADVAIAQDDGDRIRACADALTASLEGIPVAAAIHAPVVRAIVRLDLAMSDRRGGPDDVGVLARYRGSRDVEPVASLPLDFLWWTPSERDERVGSVASPGTREDADAAAACGPSLSEIGFDLDDFVARRSDQCAAENEAAVRTPQFDIVESWAIAAEIAAGGSGRQCFKVGRVAAALAGALGFSDERCVVLEMGCRVRDLGRAAVDCIAGDDGSRVDATRTDAERARAAERMLSFSDDPVLAVAARIAKHRGAWWNGSGFPAASRGEAIPIEARICAVADALVEMVDPLDRRRRWPIERAVRQIDCLGGVRFDPTLVGLLARVLRGARADTKDVAERTRPASTDDSLSKAKKHLFETLALVD